jgi:hypothetical protein
MVIVVLEAEYVVISVVVVAEAVLFFGTARGRRRGEGNSATEHGEWRG